MNKAMMSLYLFISIEVCNFIIIIFMTTTVTINCYHERYNHHYSTTSIMIISLINIMILITIYV